MTDVPEAVVARGLKKRFGSIRAVDGMDLVVPRGSCFGLIGENGAGKTTFIKLLLGICRADDGDVRVLGGSPHEPAVRRGIGYLPERLTLPAAFSAVSFLKSVGRLKGMTAPELNDQVPRVLHQVGLAEEAWGRRTGAFSKGMKQRTGLAAALLGDPKLLVLDEPTDGIDPLGRSQIRGVIADAVRKGATVFLNSHLLAETEKICDHVAVCSQGRIVVSGPLAVLKAKDAYKVRFAHAEGLADQAARHGFMPDATAPALPDEQTFAWKGSDAIALSAALQGALGAGLIVIEVSQQLRDLETILGEAIEQRKRT